MLHRAAFSDMSILEQHFYTDAGVSLPVSETKPKKCDRIPKLVPRADLKNATDDTKASLQKINKEVVNLKLSKSDSRIGGSKTNRNKRHSSVFLSNDIGEREKKALNRRSLSAIPTRELSRIPVSSKSVTNLTESKVDTARAAQTKAAEAIQRREVVKQKSESYLSGFRSNVGSCNKENSPKVVSNLPVLMK